MRRQGLEDVAFLRFVADRLTDDDPAGLLVDRQQLAAEAAPLELVEEGRPLPEIAGQR
jgi:hypothetical protein